VESFFLRPKKAIIAGGAFALLTSVAMPAIQAQGTDAQQSGGQAAAGQKNYKDRGEYDIYSKVTQTTDPKARLELLNTWQDKYPQTDYSQERNEYYLLTLSALAPNDPTARQKLLDKAADVLKTDPKNFRAMYLTAVWGPAVGGATPTPDVLNQVQTAAQGVVDNIGTAFDPAKKPAQVSQPDFDKAKAQALGIAHNALAWVATTKKDNATAENEYKASLDANPEQGNISAAYGKLLIEEKKYPEGLFEYARAGEYAGPGPALPEAGRKQAMDYFNKAYKDYHGSTDGADAIMTQAKTQALPPSGLAITSQADMANKQADAINARISSDPAYKIWLGLKQSLTADNGDQVFNSQVKDADIPGGAEGVKSFTGTVISIDPPDRPTKVVLGVDDPTKPDATLEFSQALPASALEKIKVGEKLDFSGVADSYTKDPYMLTFKDPTVPGVQTTAPARKGTKKRTH
jgi:Tfp pilus assembly protein PilF